MKKCSIKMSRNVAVDFVKVIMSFFVIYTHSVQYTNELVCLSMGSIENYVCMVLYAVSLTAVPSFLMISSMFLVCNDKEDNRLKLVKK